MGGPKRTIVAVIGSTMALSSPTMAVASGRAPILPVTERFKSQQACLHALEATYAQDRLQVAPLTIDANGATRRVELITKGVERGNPRRARYDATLWRHNGWPRPDLPASPVETRHSYEHRIRECAGKVMKTWGETGYTLSTFDPEAGQTP